MTPTTPTQVQSSTRREGGSLVGRVLLWLSVITTFATALAAGWFLVNVHLFGVAPDSGDYRGAAGIFGTGAVLLGLTPAVALLMRLPFTSSLVAGLGATVLVLMTIDSLRHAAALGAEPYDDSWGSGVGFVATLPWMWALPVMLLVGVCLRRGDGSTAAPRP